MIKVYANKLVDCEAELHEVAGATTLLDWFYADGLPRSADIRSLPISVFVEGVHRLPGEWSTLKIDNETEVEIYREPKGTDPFSITFALVFGAKAVLAALMPKIPTLNNGSSQKGKDIDLATVKGNQVKLNSVIREIAGHRRVYPDYALPPHRFFPEALSQWVEMLLIVGKGKYLIDPASIKIGETPLIALGVDASFLVYGPGFDVSGDPAAVWWHAAPEVSATSTGSAGLELKATFAISPNPNAASYQFTANQINIPSGSGAYPAGWAAGMLIRVVAPYLYNVADGTGLGGRDLITGPLAQIAPFVGMQIEIVGANAGLYTVASYSVGVGMTLDYASGGPATGLQIGNLYMAIGFFQLRWRIVSASTSSLVVQRLTNTGATDLTWPGFDPQVTNAAVVTLDGSNLEGDWAGPFPACPSDATTQQIQWDINFPQGLAFVDPTGYVLSNTVKTELQWRDMALGGAWTSVMKTYTQSTLSQLGFTEDVALPYAMQPEIRMRRIGAKSTSTSAAETVQWYGLKARLLSPSSYEGVTTIALRVRGGNRIASQSESLVSVEATRILPVLSGGVWQPEQPTRSISSWIGYVAKNVGYTDADLDLVELQRLENIWTARGDTYDQAVEGQTTVKASLIEALRAGFSELTLDRGLIRPVRDEPRGPAFDHMYNPMVMSEPLSRDFTSSTIDDFDGVDVEYTDGGSWQVETVPCRLPGDLGARVETIKIQGVTNRDKAWQIGMRQRRMQIYRRKSYSFSTELDALNSRYLDYVALGDNVPGYGQSSYMTSISVYADGFLVGTSEPLDWSTPGNYLAVIRRKDGTASGPHLAAFYDEYHFILTSLDFVPDLDWTQEPPFIQFGPESVWCYPALITEISPSGKSKCKVQAVNYDPRVYLDDNGTAPA